MDDILAYLQAARPKTLIASVSPVIIGTALAAYMGTFFDSSNDLSQVTLEGNLPSTLLNCSKHIGIFLCTLFAAVLLQIASNFFNDAIDFDRGADTNERFGPTRVTQAGLLSSSKVKEAGAFCASAAIVLGIPLVIHGGMPIVAIGLSAAFFSWGYTGGPFPLSYNGLGELFVLIYYGIIAVSGTYYLQTLEWNLSFTFPAGAACGAFGMALIGVNNFRDINQDRTAKKRTLAVRFGEDFSKRSIICFLLAPYVITIGATLSFSGGMFSLLLLLPFIIPLLLTIKIIRLLCKSIPSGAVNGLLGMISLNQLLFTCVGAICPIFIYIWSF